MRVSLGLVACCVVSSACASSPAVVASPDASRPIGNYLCRYFLNPYDLADGALRLGPGGDVFAKVKRARPSGAELILPFGEPAQGLRTTFTSGWVTFQAQYVPDADFRVRLNAAVAFSPVLTWVEGDWVRWRGSTDAGLMRIAAEAPADFTPSTPLEAVVACQGTTIGSVKSVGETEARVGRVVLVGASIPVSEAPGGPVHGQLRADGHVVDTLQVDGDWVRIRMRLDPGRVDGWVPAAMTKPYEEVATAMGNLFGFGGLGLRDGGQQGGRGTPDFSRCTGEATLYLSRDGAPLASVAKVHKKAALTVVADRGDWVEVTVPEDDWVQLEPGYAFVMPTAELSKCALRAGTP